MNQVMDEYNNCIMVEKLYHRPTIEDNATTQYELEVTFKKLDQDDLPNLSNEESEVFSTCIPPRKKEFI